MKRPLLSSARKAWSFASQLLTRPDGGGPTSAFSASRLIVAAGLTLSLLQGCAGHIALQENRQQVPVPADFTCVPVGDAQKLRPDLDMQHIQDFPASSQILSEVKKNGLRVCTSPSAGDYLNPQLQRVSSERPSNDGVVLAGYLMNYHVILVENIPLGVDALLHESLHGIQLNGQVDNVDLEKMKISKISVKTLQSIVIHDAGTMAMQAIMEYRRNLREPSSEREEFLLDKANPNVIPKLYQHLSEQIKKDPSLLNELGDAQTVPSDRVLDDLMSHFVGKASELYVASPIRSLGKYAQHHPEIPVECDIDDYSTKDVALTTLGPLRKEGDFPLTKKTITELGGEMSSALEGLINQDTMDPKTLLKKVQPLSRRFQQG